jgi:hypothetical protein
MRVRCTLWARRSWTVEGCRSLSGGPDFDQLVHIFGCGDECEGVTEIVGEWVFGGE